MARLCRILPGPASNAILNVWLHCIRCARNPWLAILKLGLIALQEYLTMPGANPVKDLNQQLARSINEEARRDPSSPYANKFVGIAGGQVVVIADDVDEMVRRLRQIEPDPSRCLGVEASRDYNVVEEICRIKIRPVPSHS